MSEIDLLAYEKKLWKTCDWVAGLDEAGRGCWAGPVVAAAVIFPKNVDLPGVNDSKKLTAEKREIFFDQILENALAFGIGIIDPKIIDEINILEASKKAMLLAVEQMKTQPQYLLIDGNMSLRTAIPQQAIISGDALSLSIAAASILAKVTRDRLMVKLSETYPGYGFEKHKGYGTAIHRKALDNLGLSPIHRLSYKPVQKVQENQLNN